MQTTYILNKYKPNGPGFNELLLEQIDKNEVVVLQGSSKVSMQVATETLELFLDMNKESKVLIISSSSIESFTRLVSENHLSSIGSGAKAGVRIVIQCAEGLSSKDIDNIVFGFQYYGGGNKLVVMNGLQEVSVSEIEKMSEDSEIPILIIESSE